MKEEDSLHGRRAARGGARRARHSHQRVQCTVAKVGNSGTNSIFASLLNPLQSSSLDPICTYRSGR